MAEANGTNGFDKIEATARTKRVDGLEERAQRAESKLKIIVTLGSVLGLCATLVGGGWTMKTYMGHVATAAEVEKLKASAVVDRERLAAIEQAHKDDQDWRTRLEQKVDKMLDWMIGRSQRRSDGR